MVLYSDLPWFTEMTIPLLTDGFLLDQLVLFAYVHPMESDGFDKLRSYIGRISPIDIGLQVHHTTEASNNNAPSPPS